MAPISCFIDDPYITYTRKCIVFPAHGEGPHLVEMTIRTVTEEDVSSARLFSRTVDLLAQYGSEYRKMRLVSCPGHLGPVGGEHVLHYNLSPKLPLNRCVAQILGINPDNLKPARELFWRGDVVVMSAVFEPQGNPYIKCQDADLSVVGGLAKMLRDSYSEGRLERELSWDEASWKSYYSKIPRGFPTSIWTIIGFHHLFGGNSWREQEEAMNFLNNINELRESVNRDPIPDSSAPGGPAGLLEMGRTTIQSALPAFFSSYRPITRLPVFPFKVERQIFEICARNSRSTCLRLVLVARRVRRWVEPILFETVVLDRFYKPPTSPDAKFRCFLANTDSRRPEFYSEHVKNLWISAPDGPDALKRVLTLCSGVENLVLFLGGNIPFIPFFELPNAGARLRRLTCNLGVLFPPWSNPTSINFHHQCFTTLTHLHLSDGLGDWSKYTGFELLRSLTHLALACCGADALAIIQPKLPVLRYVALCHYQTNQYGRPRVRPRIPVGVYGNKVVWLDGVTMRDWQCGAVGQGDFWDLVEAEVDGRVFSAGEVD